MPTSLARGGDATSSLTPGGDATSAPLYPSERRRWISLPPTRRQVRALLGLFWLLDAALQAQPRLFGATAWRVDIGQSAMGEPSWVRHGIFFTIGIISAHPVAWNSAFVAIQGLLGLALLLDRLPRLAMIASIPYVLGVWWVGEGFGTLPTGFALLAAGSPGPVLLYSLIGFLAWPRPERAFRVPPARLFSPESRPRWASRTGPAFFDAPIGRPDRATSLGTPTDTVASLGTPSDTVTSLGSPGDTVTPRGSTTDTVTPRGSTTDTAAHLGTPPTTTDTVAPRAAAAAWVILWAGQALLHVPWVYPPGQVLTANIEESSIGSPFWLVDLARHAEALVAGAPLLTTVVLVVVDVVVGLGILFRPARRPALLLGLAALVVFWVVGQDLGGILAPGGTDPSSAPLLALLAISLWPTRRQTTSNAPAAPGATEITARGNVGGFGPRSSRKRFVTFSSSRLAVAPKSNSMDTPTVPTATGYSARPVAATHGAPERHRLALGFHSRKADVDASVAQRTTARRTTTHRTTARRTTTHRTLVGHVRGVHRAQRSMMSRRHDWRRRPVGLVVLLFAGALALAACSSSTSSTTHSSATSSSDPASSSAASSPSSAPVSSIHIIIKNFAFHPDDFTVTPGAKITVTNEDSVDHTFTARNRAFNTGDIAPGQTVHVTAPTKPGTYPYLCLIHQFMTGTMTVS